MYSKFLLLVSIVFPIHLHAANCTRYATAKAFQLQSGELKKKSQELFQAHLTKVFTGYTTIVEVELKYLPSIMKAITLPRLSLLVSDLKMLKTLQYRNAKMVKTVWSLEMLVTIRATENS